MENLAGTPDVDVKSQAKTSAEQKDIATTTNAQKTALADNQRQEIRDQKLFAREGLESEKNAWRGAADTKKEERKASLRILTEAAELAKRKIQVSRTNAGQGLLIEIADLSNRLTSTNSSAIVATLNEYITGDSDITISRKDQQDSNFIRDYKSLLDTDIEAARIIRDSLRNGINNNRITSLNVTDIAVLSDLITEREQEIQRQYEQDKKRFEEQQSKQNRASYIEREEYFNLSDKIFDAIRRNLFSDDATVRLQVEDMRLVQQFHRNPGSVPIDSVLPLLEKLGITKDKVTAFRNMYDSVFTLPDVQAMTSIFVHSENLKAALQGAAEEFDVKTLLSKDSKYFTEVTDKDGRLYYTISHDQRIAFKHKIIEFYFKEVLREVHKNSSKLFDQALDQEQRTYLEYLKKIVSNSCRAVIDHSFKGEDEISKDNRVFLDDVAGRFLADILNYAQIFHDLPQHARNIGSFEKWPEFIGQLYQSVIAEAFHDEPVMEVARHVIPQYLRMRITLNGNKIPSNLFSGKYVDGEESEKELDLKGGGVYFRFKDRERIKEWIKESYKSKGYHRELTDWELERAVVYGLGVGISNLTDPEVIMSADPNLSSDFRGIYALATLSPKHNWGLGRGAPAATEFYDLLMMDVTVFPEHRNLFERTYKKKSWVPPEFHRTVLEQINKYQDKVLEVFLERDSQYLELLNMLAIAPSLLSRAGWRALPIRGMLKDKIKNKYKLDFDVDSIDKWTQFEWSQYFHVAQSEYGMASVWWLIESERLGGEMRKLLKTELGADTEITGFLYEEYDTGEKEIKFGEYLVEGKDGRLEKKTLDFIEMKMMRLYQLRGEAFWRYMKRNPGDFFMLINQCAPEILDDSKGYVFIEGVDKHATEEAIRKALEKDPSKKNIKDETEKILAKQERMKKRWGNSFKTLGELNKLFYSFIGTDEQTQFKDKTALLEALTRTSSNAFEKMLKRRDDTKDLVLYVEESDFANEDPRIRNFLFGSDNALMKMLKMENFGGFDNEGKFSIGDFGFFYHMGQAWSMKQGSESSINPFGADINNYQLYKHIGEVGEDIAMRYLGDANMVKKLIGDISKLDHLLSQAAATGDMKGIFELHEKLYQTLKPIIGRSYAYRANFILASVVAKFFYEHSDVRGGLFGAFPFNLLGKALLGKNVALSRVISGDMNAYTMDENALRTYFNKLAYEMHVIGHEGFWSNKQLELSFDARTDSFFLGNVLPSAFWFLTILIFWTNLKKAMEEAEGKKK